MAKQKQRQIVVKERDFEGMDLVLRLTLLTVANGKKEARLKDLRLVEGKPPQSALSYDRFVKRLESMGYVNIKEVKSRVGTWLGREEYYPVTLYPPEADLSELAWAQIKRHGDQPREGYRC